MSSLAAAQADGFYHPPDYDPRRHGSVSKFAGSKGSNQFQTHGVIRFEMPHNTWCLGCGRAIGQGTRYNAKKVPAGKYFSTPIYEFQMKCATCPQRFAIRTDPKARASRWRRLSFSRATLAQSLSLSLAQSLSLSLSLSLSPSY